MEIQKLLSVFLYGFSSFAITVVNKIVLTSYGFPSYAVLGVCQMIFMFALLSFLHCIGRAKIIFLTKEILLQIWPLPILYLVNLFYGLGGTKELSLPMFVVLRRFTILFTMILSQILLEERSSLQVKLAVFVMILGSVIAAWYDMAFAVNAYILVTLNNFATAINNVLIKMKLVNKDIDKQSLVFYNCLFGFLPLLSWTVYNGDISQALAFTGWFNSSFLLVFFMSCSSAYVLNISTTWCIEANSPLTTTIVGVLKNSVITYLGMFIGGDYIFNWPNFMGVTVSLMGALIYTTAASSRPTVVEERKVEKASPTVV